MWLFDHVLINNLEVLCLIFLNVVAGPNVPRALVVAAERWLIRPS